ncbi:hypothetical protein G6L37_22425 [Agrobacterium rubi]|uniref:hypothetical protein n=1 Tax=Agrobacterium rubi TaxID=28099 RepID=UPI001571CA69|nr:hypothetical protein [Agrobacterium rubi]NTF08890.1 hypothetical protein [Agrobacterium rubi]NTF21161.1 hypothetical protein [Agrobacterium rubi]NTF28018.1 hypothetical protein [Agrobacterium rubi]
MTALSFYAALLDQMDLALEHLDKGSVHDARFALMLTDNAVELAIHKLATEKYAHHKSWYRLEESYPHKQELAEALGQSFETKLKFARREKMVTEEQARSVVIMHDFRNELYHVGLQHEPILTAIAPFYFWFACDILKAFPGFGLSYGNLTVIPDRAKKYFRSSRRSPAELGDFETACGTLKDRCAFTKGPMIGALADHIEQIIVENDAYMGVVSVGAYPRGQGITRDQATIDCQVWRLAFAPEGHKFARENGFSGSSIQELVRWLGQHFPLRIKKDPLPGWRRRVTRLRSKGSPHLAIATYVDFLNETAQFRQDLAQSCAAAEAEIERQIDEYRSLGR